MNFQSHRPEGFKGAGDRKLPMISKDLSNYLLLARRIFKTIMGHFSPQELQEFSSALVEFAEDLHNDLGMWRSLENYNREFFGTPLPLVLRSDDEAVLEGINPYRLRHFMWVMYPHINIDFVPSPDDPDFCKLAEQVSTFLRDRFRNVPADSGVRTFLEQPDEFGWQVKRKLVWMGTHSYLFRHCFAQYLNERELKPAIPVIDDFICQAATEWSGLGVIDILAALLNISEAERADLRSWYERHLAVYKVVSIAEPMTEVVNVFNDRPYRVRTDEHTGLFKKIKYVYGSLVPWRGDWYWSGGQADLGDLSKQHLGALKNQFMQTIPAVMYRYRTDLLEKAKENIAYQQRIFIERFGKPLAIFPDIPRADGALQEYFRAISKARAKELGIKPPSTGAISYFGNSEGLPDKPDGVAAFFVSGEGIETMWDFNPVISGFKKKGQDLDEEEAEMIRQFTYAEEISPEFVNYMVERHGAESIFAAFLITRPRESSSLQYLLRRYKGQYYRNRYPAISFVDV